MRRNVPNGNIGPSSPRIVSWASLEQHWEQAMRNQRDLAEEYDRFLKEQPPHLSDDQRARSAPCPATCRRSGMHRRRQRLTARRLSAWWWIASWSMSELTVSAPKW